MTAPEIIVDDEPAILFTETNPHRYGLHDHPDRRALNEAQKALEPRPPVLAAAIVVAGAVSFGFIAGFAFACLIN